MTQFLIASALAASSHGLPLVAQFPFEPGAIIREVHQAFHRDGATSFVSAHRVRRAEVALEGTLNIAAPGRAPIWLKTEALTLGKRSLDARPSNAELDRQGCVTIRWGEVEEVFRSAGDGVEQAWRFERPLVGAIRVEVSIEGATFERTSEAGVRFAAPGGGALSYGHATWVDARGMRARVMAQHINGRVRLEVPAEVVARSAFPAVLDPLIGPEFPVDDAPVPVGVTQATMPTAAFGGGIYLVTWQERRLNGEVDIFGARVDASGVLLDPVGIGIGLAFNYQEDPAAAFDGSRFLVVWNDARGYTPQIYGCRVELDGTVTDPDGLQITTAASSPFRPAIAFDGTQYLVVWSDWLNGQPDIYGARVRTNGQVIDTTPFPISVAAGRQSMPKVAWSGSQFLVVWEESGAGDDVNGARVTSTGRVVDGDGGFVIAGGPALQRSPVVASNGAEWVVAWAEEETVSSNVRVSRVSAGGAVLDPGGVAVSAAAGDRWAPAIAAQGSGYVVAWQDTQAGSAVYASRLSSTGSLKFEDPSGILVAGIEYFPALAAGPSGALVMGEAQNIWTVLATPLDTGGVVGPTLTVSRAMNRQLLPAVAFNGSRYLVVWEDNRDDNADVYGVRVDRAGRVLDSTPLAIAVGIGDQQHPAVAANGSEFMVVWVNDDFQNGQSDVLGVRVAADGALIDATPISIKKSPSGRLLARPRIASGANGYLAVWEDNALGTWDIGGAQVSQGIVLDPAGLAISTAPDHQFSPDVSFDGTNYLVVWEDYRSGGRSDVWGARVSGAGSVLEPSGIQLSSAVADQDEPAVAFDGREFLVAWRDWRNSGSAQSSADIYGSRVTRGGVVVDPTSLRIATGPQRQQEPSMVFDGTSFVVAWTDWGRSGGIFATRIGDAGEVLDDGGYPLFTGAPGYSEALAAGNGAVLAVASRFDVSRRVQMQRVRARFIDSMAPGAPVIVKPIDGGTVFTPRPDLGGLAEPGAWVVIFLDGADAGRTVADDVGDFVFATPTLGQGEHRVYAFAEDGARNRSPPSAEITFAVLLPDAGPAVDAGTDAGAEAPNDAGFEVDAGSDGGPEILNDAGTGPRAYRVGCGCSATRDGLMVSLVMILLIGRTRPRPRPGT